MNDLPREALQRLIGERGVALARDRARLGGFLRDECGEAKREINLLLDAVDERVVEDLLAASGEPTDVLVMRLAERLTAQRGTTSESAKWAVETWALALGKIATTDLREHRADPSPTLDATVAPSAFERALAVFRTADGRPKWVPIGVAIAIVIALSASRLTDNRAPRITRVELAGVVFEGSRDTRAQLIGDGRRYPAKIFFEDQDGDVNSLLINRVNGVWANGNPTNTRALRLAGLTRGSFETETFSVTGTEIGEVSLVLVDAAGRRSWAFLIRYEGVAPPPAATPPRPQIRIPAQLPGLGNIPPIQLPNPIRR